MPGGTGKKQSEKRYLVPPTLTAGRVKYPRNEDLARVEVAVLGTILAVTILGNVCILFIIYRRKKKLTRMHLFIVHLGIADLAVGLFQILPQMIWKITFRFIGSDILCRTVKYAQVMSMFASTYMLLMMTIDRYVAVCHPLKTLQQPSRHAYIMIGATWIFSSLLSLPQIFIFSLTEIGQNTVITDCWADFRYPWGAKAYITWTTVSIFIVPVGILVLCYSLICCEICKNLKGKMQNYETGQRENSGHMPSRVSSIRTISRAKIRTVKMTFVIVLSYIICWTPFFSVQMWTVWDENAPDHDSSDFAFTITMLLASLSSCSNPWIYMFYSGPHLCGRTPLPHAIRQNSTGSASSRRDTLLTRIRNNSLVGGKRMKGHAIVPEILYPAYEDTVIESGLL
ncbi:LOW QUALITY PROTEIN: vasopressin V1b receptor [Bombina bombina]|uniref:LOW QUALITY PROTEIN: vasopressin V1b receptor n=1 Tax=Bombina bombina TaxID=8345 RepID=UPI00235AF142|nr:LOW QUALITY PROTEIN: vasopressin V1b receptor [Bombina bombina]